MLTDTIEIDLHEGQDAIWVFRTNEQLREHFPAMPGRGQAQGGFVGPFRIAALTAWDVMRQRGVDVDILFHDATS